jgi:hypothetical protein
VVYGDNHHAGQLGDSGPPRPSLDIDTDIDSDSEEKETLKRGIRC